MPGIDPEVICHKLFIKADAKPIKQKPRRMKKGVVPSVTKLTVYFKLASSERRSTLTGSLTPFHEEKEWKVESLH